jgi:hypothetical protein
LREFSSTLTEASLVVSLLAKYAQEEALQAFEAYFWRCVDWYQGTEEEGTRCAEVGQWIAREMAEVRSGIEAARGGGVYREVGERGG